MNQELEFSAPWQPALKVVSLVTTILLAALALHGAHTGALWQTALCLGLVVSTLPFTIRGYVLTPNEIFIRRLGWNSRIALDGLQSVAVDPAAFRGSIRTCGNGGLFSITGWYWNKRLRGFRAFATDCGNAVVLRFPDRTIIVTPSDPARFADELNRLRNG